MKFTGIPNLALELFHPLADNDLIFGAVGVLQFKVVAHRLKTEYGVAWEFKAVDVSTARWVYFPDTERDFHRKNEQNLALDRLDALTYIAPNRASLQFSIERWPTVQFRATREF